MDFNEKLQALRKQRGLTQEELARYLFVSRAAVSKWESGRGYPGIDSLKAIASFFSITIDELLSGSETLAAAEESSHRPFPSLLFGLLDLSSTLFFLLPLFGQRTDGILRSASLLSLSGTEPYLKTAYFAVIIGMIVSGALILVLRKCREIFWIQNRGSLSMALNAAGALLFILSRQPYPAAILFFFLIFKLSVLRRCR